MKNVLPAFCVGFLLAGLNFNSAWAESALYTQISAGVSLGTKVDTVSFDYDDGIDEFSGMIRAEGKTDFTLGVELGVDGLLNDRFRLGVSYDYVPAGFKSLRLIGSLNGSPVNEVIFDPDEAGLDFDYVAKGHFIFGNAYVNLTPQSPFDIYIGGGAGAAFVSEVETGLAVNGTASVEFPLSERWAAGIRYRYVRASNLREKFFGIEFEPVQTHLISFTVAGRSR